MLSQTRNFMCALLTLTLLWKNGREQSRIKFVVMSIPNIARYKRGATFKRQRGRTTRHIRLTPEECDRCTFIFRYRAIGDDSHDLILLQSTQNAPCRTLHRNDADTFLFALILQKPV